MSEFITLPIVAMQKPYAAEDGTIVTPPAEMVELRVRKQYVIASSNLLVPPDAAPESRAVVYFHADSGMRQEFTTLDAATVTELAE